MLLPSSIEKIIASGGGVSIDASRYVPSSLERFAAYASQSGAKIILRNSDKLMPSTMARIAAYGNGNVIFNLDEDK